MIREPAAINLRRTEKVEGRRMARPEREMQQQQQQAMQQQQQQQGPPQQQQGQVIQ